MGRDEINAFLGAGTSYEGQLSFQGAVRIDGVFKGTIRSEGTLIVGKDAAIEGTVSVGELIVSGNITGEIAATRRIVLHRTGNVQGTITAPAMVMEEGATLQGQMVMQAAACPE